MTPELCTRCNREAPIRQRDVIGGIPGWEVPYQLCGGCTDYQASILDDDQKHAAFAEDLWARAAVQSLKPIGTA